MGTGWDEGEVVVEMNAKKSAKISTSKKFLVIVLLASPRQKSTSRASSDVYAWTSGCDYSTEINRYIV